ncbi:MAG: cobalt-precorrin-5B (C(1))-methyltransferase CbiD [bacterium]
MTALRSGYTTGACAAAAAKAAAIALIENRLVTSVDIPFPDGSRATFAIASPPRPCVAGEQDWQTAQAFASKRPFLPHEAAGDLARDNVTASAAVKKDAGDDPDVTDGVLIVATVARNDSGEILFCAGEGVGTVTKPGLQIPPGQPAINPGPRRMICAALREVTPDGLNVTLSIPGGRELAARTFNPRLGVVDGLSILGTSGQVRPFSAPALRDALVCTLNVALASGVTAPVLVPGHIGQRAALAHFKVTPEQVIEVSNEWGFMLEQAAAQKIWPCLLLVGHPGKLAKLAEGHWETHSAQSPTVLPFISRLAATLGIQTSTEVTTAEGLFLALPEPRRKALADRLASDIQAAVGTRTGKTIAVMLVSMNGEKLGTGGELSPWL